MIEMYFDFRLYRLWKTRQHSKLLDYEDLLWQRGIAEAAEPVSATTNPSEMVQWLVHDPSDQCKTCIRRGEAWRKKDAATSIRDSQKGQKTKEEKRQETTGLTTS